ncbi:ferrochelatase [Taklimakanibacter deserti]|uniref:ferrochelatase n=1 Tax=Taklimakanibacter deserti TaxID=2267839 RepID=UPI000E64BF16
MLNLAESGDPKVKGRIGVLIVNLGTPEATSYWPMRRYLKEFLSDPRVVETNRLLWWFILNGIILTTRPKRSGHAYEKIWNRELDESPLKTITRAQAEKLAAELRGDGPILLDWGMRYGSPPVGERLKALKEQGCERILIFPLYPQYSAATTATVADKVFEAMADLRWQPALRFVPPYYGEPVHIDALAESIDAHLATLDWVPDVILASYHGLPESYVAAGDPYYRHCQETTRLLRAKLDLSETKLRLVFQSRFGRAEWLKPYAQDTVASLPGQGVRHLVMVMPGFAADCVETLEEVAIGLAETFRENGGINFSAVPCLNDSDVAITMMALLIRQELAGWL